MITSKLEIACFNAESAIIAQLGRADRIELCENKNVGGVSPSVEFFKFLRPKISIPINVMIRPRGGNFIYSKHEFKEMENKIIEFKNIGADGFVFGILNDSKEIDIERNSELISLCENFPCTFHKAFDETNDFSESLERIINIGFSDILTSGGKQCANDGINALLELKQKAKNRIEIMPGGGIRSSNIKLLNEKLNLNFYHSSAIIDDSEFVNFDEVKSLKKVLSA